MRTSAALAVAILIGGKGAAVAPAASLDMQDRQVLEAIGTLIAIDHLRGRCAAAERPPLADKVRAWDAARGARLRAAIAATRRDAAADATYREMERRMAAALAPRDAQACALLAGALDSPPPAVVAGGPPLSSGASAAPYAPAPGLRNKADAPGRPAPTGSIAAFGMLLYYGMGYGGMMVASYDPVVLYSDGSILTDVTGLADPAADRRTNPGHWSRWRQTGGRYEYLTRDGQWRAIPADQVWKNPPNADRLAGRFTHVGGGGNVALGGTSAVFAQTSYAFLPGGRVVREGLASSTAEAGNVRTVTGGSSGARVGRYSVSGFTIDVRYDDGKRETMVLMTHPRDPNIIWLDGVAYTRPK